MNRTQKGACYGLLLTLIFLAVPVLDKFESNLGMLGTHLIGYCVLLPALIVPLFLLRKKSGKKEVEFDERDKSIIKKGILAGFVIVTAMALIGYVVILIQNKVVTAEKLPDILYAGFAFFIFSLSVAVLIQYRLKGASHE